jgi:hypothetical protein
MKPLRLILLIVLLLGILAAAYVYFFVYNKPQPDYSQETPAWTLPASQIFEEFKKDKTASDKKYTGKVVAVSGTMKNVETAGNLTIVVFVFAAGDFGDEGVRCTLLPASVEKVKKLAPGENVVIKGYCTGYNDTDVIIEKCTLM